MKKLLLFTLLSLCAASLHAQYVFDLQSVKHPVARFADEQVSAYQSAIAEKERRPVVKEEPSIPCEAEYVAVEDGVFIDRYWLEREEYYWRWGADSVNPYEYDVTKFPDTVALNLVCYEEGRGWSMPVYRDKVNSEYGPRRWRWHHGVDMDLEVGEPIYAVFDGIVRIARYNWGGFGHYVMIRHHNGLETLYGHLSERVVTVGDTVQAGQLIGLGGNTGRSTGAHLHFETRYQGHAFDPLILFDFDSNQLLHEQFVLTREHYKGLIADKAKQYHRIRRGESLWTISRRYRVSIGQLCRMNGISRRTTLRVGKQLRVR